MTARTRWRLSLIAAAVLVVLGLAWLRFAPRHFPAPDFARVARPPGEAERRVPLPILMLPRKDLDNGVGVVCVFVDRRRRDRTSLTVVFHDEDHPWTLVDRAYDLFRWSHFRRVMDVETFTYRHEGDEARPGAIDFDDVFAGDQRWDVLLAEHLSAVVRLDAFEQRDGRPVIYVNTWNHMFSQRDNNPGLELVTISAYPVYQGDREDCEAIFRAVRAGE